MLDRPMGSERVTSLVQSRTPVLLGEIADLVRSRPELLDPRIQALWDYDQERGRLGRHARAISAALRRCRAASDDLHIHPNTLRYRVGRAQEILGMSLENPDARLLLQIQFLIGPSRSRSVGR